MDDFVPDDFVPDDARPLAPAKKAKTAIRKIRTGIDIALSPIPQARTIANTAMDFAEDPIGSYEAAPAALSAAASLVNPLLAPVGAMAGKSMEIGAKKVFGDKRPTTPTLMGFPIPSIPKVPNAVSDVAVEGFLQAPIEAARLVSTAAKNIAPLRAAKSMGATKRFFNTPRKLTQAKEAGQIMLDENVVTPLATSERMLEKVENLQDTAGARIGQFLTKQKEGIDPNKLIDAIEQIRPVKREGQDVLMQLAKEGKTSSGFYDDINQVLDKAIDTIKAHGNKPLDFQTANKVKGLLQSVNWNSDTLKSIYARQAAGATRAGIDEELGRIADASGKVDQFRQFLKDKKAYGASESAKDYLYNLRSSELGNRDLGLTDFLTMGAGATTGDVQKVGGLLGIKKTLDKFGNQTIAVLADRVAKNPDILPALIRALQARKSKEPK